ncbi:hypothetical protein O6H91_03G121600 [Diphasiastrum complanatum]|uniref:Uncharacterized protein n=2 Tax=Diphasiastrum complanatum TaxID=34168 RepID=A0ACC2EB49_DIPCM|nr:hypothetical protein O6H91_Y285700 [Diphasiastrum complanatum]KAJ7292317.1 hypothetical protein O6H91_Y285700 [Diphasiastrum complanatum]KAJ7292318.1 hypothetical protein O6H91_Y285700 [Diphasiastrum complanatum]KAJ7563691.1 hypothetical protein O6H91_03G121600 [Diphasiastrum complanatum]KAJ7563692.1 hypothetical protein O6H91_03G121600 [Diphasiastrum complanatum]
MDGYPLLEGESRPKQEGRSNFVVAYALIASICSAMSGYSSGVMSGAVLFIREDLNINYIQEEILLGSLVLVSLVGTIVASLVADTVGRKKSMLVAAIIVLFGCLLMGLAPSFWVLLLGRIITGIGYGFSFMVVPLYIAEVSPPEIRGRFLSFPELFLNSGILLGYVSSFCLAKLPVFISWRLMVGLGALPAIILAFGISIIPESPRWLVLQGRINEAFSTLILTSDHESEAEQRLNDIIVAAGNKKHKDLASAGDAVESTDHKLHNKMSDRDQEAGVNLAGTDHKHQLRHVWLELLWPTTSNLRFTLFVVLGLQFFQQATGVCVLLYYSPDIFQKAGFHSSSGSLGATVMVGIAKDVSIPVATIFLDRIGRRPLLLLSNIGVTVSLLTIATRFSVQAIYPNSTLHGYLTIAACCSFMIFFSMGFGPIGALLPSEILPLRLRAQGMGLSTAFNRCLSGILSLSFLSIFKAFGAAGTFWLFAGMSSISIFFLYFFVPETKGRTLEELS